MVGLLGCGCCACCAEPTSKWTADFATTPTVGAVWDEVTLVSGAGARSYAPVKPAGNSSKISRLTINADQTSPLYLGFNGNPTGATLYAEFYGKPDAAIPSWVEPISSWKAPPVQAGQTHRMLLEIYTELIYNVGADEVRSGIYTKWQKNFLGTSSGSVAITYTLHMYGYRQVNGGTRTKQIEYGPNTVTYSPSSLTPGPRPSFRTKHEINKGGELIRKCDSIVELKQATTDYWNTRSGNNFIEYLAVNSPGPYSLNDQKFDCFVGWNSEVHWTTVVGSGMGFPVGTFDFNNYYIEWKSARWL